MNRIANDHYPTPPDLAALVELKGVFAGVEGPVLDPCAGSGSLLEWAGVPRKQRRAIELRPEARSALLGRVPSIHVYTGVDALERDWSGHSILANPPFKLLDQFARKALMNLYTTARCVVCILAPTQWLQAQRRADIPCPQLVISPRWRPRFRAGSGGGASHDVSWHVWDDFSIPTSWARHVWSNRPLVPAERLAEYREMVEAIAAQEAPR